MSLIINQGVQPKEEEKKFEVITENNVKLVVDSITLCTFKQEALNVKFRILTGVHKNQFVSDTVDYNPDSNFSWKYRSLRACAGVPYKEGESAQIDIEKLLVGRVVTADLSARPGKDKEGNMKDYQNIKYKKALENAEPAKAETTIDVIDTDELPFAKAVETPVAQTPKAKESTVINDVADWD